MAGAAAGSRTRVTRSSSALRGVTAPALAGMSRATSRRRASAAQRSQTLAAPVGPRPLSPAAAPVPAPGRSGDLHQPDSMTLSSAQLQQIVSDAVRAALDNAPAALAERQPTPAVPACGAPAPPAGTVAINAAVQPLLGQVPARLDGAAAVFPVPGTDTGDSGVNVAANLRQNIINNKYVDMCLLLDAQAGQPDDRDPIFRIENGRLRSARPQRSISTFSTWCVAFLRFAEIYLQAHPADALGMLLHMQQVSGLTASGLGLAWRDFDEQFRRAREADPARYCWGATQASSPLYLNAIARGMAAAAVGSNSTNAGVSTVNGSVCFSFNKPGGCTRGRCMYAHICRVCNGAHSVLRCPRRPTFPRNTRGSKPALLTGAPRK